MAPGLPLPRKSPFNMINSPRGPVEIIDRPRPRANGSNRPFPAVRAPTPGCAELANLLRAVVFGDLDGKLSCIMSFGWGGRGPWPDGRRKPIGESSGSQVTP